MTLKTVRNATGGRSTRFGAGWRSDGKSQQAFERSKTDTRPSGEPPVEPAVIAES